MARAKQDSIPVHKLLERTNVGIDMRYLNNIEETQIVNMEAHRDDHYIFMLHETGHTKMDIDFRNLDMIGLSVLYILPGQVHEVGFSSQATGFFMAIDAALVDERYRTIFEELVLYSRPLTPLPEISGQLKRCAALLYDVFNVPPGSVNQPVLHALASAFIGMIAEMYEHNEPLKSHQNSRVGIITTQFKKLLSDSFKTLKNPSDYAASLCLSLSYLNEAVKLVTGFPVSYWIHQQVILEAKRLLYYSDLDVKEIAFSLGYDDHTYFSRLFKKVTGSSAIQFRKKYRR